MTTKQKELPRLVRQLTPAKKKTFAGFARSQLAKMDEGEHPTIPTTFQREEARTE